MTYQICPTNIKDENKKNKHYSLFILLTNQNKTQTQSISRYYTYQKKYFI